MSQKPFIAKDTKKPLVIMGGYKIVEGGKIGNDPIKFGEKPKASKEDIQILLDKGQDWLVSQQFFGVIDRLKNSDLWVGR